MVKQILGKVSLPLLLLAALACVLLTTLAAGAAAFDFSVTFMAELLGTSIRLVGTAMIGFMCVKFASIYKRRPSRTRLLVLITFIMFFTALLADCLTDAIKHRDKVIRNFLMDLILFLISYTLYYLVLFGLEVLISPGTKQQSVKLENVLFVLRIISVVCYIVEMVLDLPFHSEVDGIFRDVAMMSAYILAFLCLVLVVVMIVMCMKVSRKVEEPVQKKGLVSLGVSFTMLVASLIILVVMPIVDAAQEIGELAESIARAASIVLLIIGIYFMHSGFIKPAVSIRHDVDKS